MRYNSDMKTGGLDKRSKQLRKLIIDMMAAAHRGHPGAALSAVEILRVLYDDILSYRPTNPNWEKRDRFILSKGHGCLAFYAILADKGFFPMSDLATYCADNGKFGGHPEFETPGVEASTGSLGHGFPIGVGMAIAAKIKKAPHRIFVLTGDGECDEGSIWEAALSAGKHKLSNLTVIIDYNKMQAYSTTTEVADLEPFADKWKSFGFAVREVDGHNVSALKKVFKQVPFNSKKPSAIICHTLKGKGISYAENNPTWQHKPKLTDEDIASLYKALRDY
jgi:transketolase